MKNATGSGGQEAVPIGNVGVGQQWGEGISRVVLYLHPLQTPFDKALTWASDSKILSWAQIHSSNGLKIYSETFNFSYFRLSRELASAWSRSLYAPNTLKSMWNSLSRISSYSLPPAPLKLVYAFLFSTQPTKLRVSFSETCISSLEKVDIKGENNFLYPLILYSLRF